MQAQRSPTKTGVCRLYGVQHSPWVQGVLLGFHIRQVPYVLVTCPISWRGYLERGLIMPECHWPDGTLTVDSFEILNELERRYPLKCHSLPRLSEREQGALERLFLSYVLGRTAGSKKVAFIAAWSRMPSGQGAGFASISRAFMCLYFWALIFFGRHVARQRRFDPDNFDEFARQLKYWSSHLEDTNYISGDVVGLLDIALFGQVQCMASGLTDETFPILKSHPQFMDWIKRMQTATPDYSNDFSNRLTGFGTKAVSASFGDQILFWVGLLLALCAFPLTLLFLGDAFRRRYTNPSRTGSKLKKH